MASITTDFTQESLRPYFLWDEDVSVARLREILAGGEPFERERLIGKMLREARDIDVWAFMTPTEVADVLPRVERRLGRRARFWRFLIDGWREDGLL